MNKIEEIKYQAAIFLRPSNIVPYSKLCGHTFTHISQYYHHQRLLFYNDCDHHRPTTSSSSCHQRKQPCISFNMITTTTIIITIINRPHSRRVLSKSSSSAWSSRHLHTYTHVTYITQNIESAPHWY